MSKNDTVSDFDVHIIQEAPSELECLIALNSAIEASRLAEADKKYIEAALEIKSLTDFNRA